MTGYHITEQKNIKKFDISRVGSGMGTSFYGYGLYFALDKATCEQYYKQFPNDRDYFIYKVSIDSRKIFSEDDKMLSSSMSVLEQYAQLVEEFGSEEAASKKIIELGVDGIKYWSHEDGNSVVVYNDKILRIVQTAKCKDIFSVEAATNRS